ncbi:hypothetical protein GFPCMMHI_04975 [Ensifer adhaerens]|nr:hypothetical protein [Ensifer adhaerens]
MEQGSTPTESDVLAAIQGGNLLALMDKVKFADLHAIGANIAKIHNEGGLDAIAFFDDFDWSGVAARRDHTRLSYILRGLVSAIDDETVRIVEFLHRVFLALGQNSAYELRQAFEDWLSADTERAPVSVQIILSLDGDSPFVGPALVVWRRNASTDALQETLNICKDVRSEIRRQAIYALSGFASAEEELQEAAATELATIITGNSGDDKLAALSSAASMISEMSEAPPDLVSALEKACEDPSPAVRHQIIAGWAFRQKKFPIGLRNLIVDLMRTVTTEFQDTLDLVDTAISNMDVAQERAEVFSLISAILAQPANPPPLQALDSTIYKIRSSSHADLGWFTTSWLLAGDFEICLQVHNLYQPLDQQIYDFDIADFDLRPIDVAYLTRKIFGFLLFCHGPAVSLLYACLSAVDVNERQTLEREIAFFWLRNFPDDLKLFDAALAAHPRTGMKASIKRLHDLSSAYEDELKKLPRNPALRPSPLERQVQAEIARDQHADIMKSAKRNSILASMFRESVLLYGRTSISYIYNGQGQPVRQVIPLKSFETSAALPRMDGLYPARFSYIVQHFRNERRPN